MLSIQSGLSAALMLGTDKSRGYRLEMIEFLPDTEKTRPYQKPEGTA